MKHNLSPRNYYNKYCKHKLKILDSMKYLRINICSSIYVFKK